MFSFSSFLVFALIFTIAAEQLIQNPAELSKFIRKSRISGEKKQILEDYSDQGLISYPFSPNNFLSSVQNLFGQVFGGFMRLPPFSQFFAPTDTRIVSPAKSNLAVVAENPAPTPAPTSN